MRQKLPNRLSALTKRWRVRGGQPTGVSASLRLWCSRLSFNLAAWSDRSLFTRKQAGIMQKALDAATKAANAAHDSANLGREEFNASHRPRITVIGVAIT